MSVSLVLTVIGDDKPGLVDTLSQALVDHEANWLESRMSHLAGKFAGILLASVPDANARALTDALRDFESRGLGIVVEESAAAESAETYRSLNLSLVGQDRPGIVHDISHVLASRKINIDELNTECSSASWSGETLFHASARLRIPPAVSIDELREILEGLANELMVDIALDESPAV